MADSEDQVNLKKRARRRVVGAIALFVFVIIALPMVFDKEPKPLSHDISVQIPNPDSSAFQHKMVPTPPSIPGSLPSGQPAPSTPAPAAPSASVLPPAAAPVPAPVAAPAVPAKPVSQAGNKADAKTAPVADAIPTPPPLQSKPAAAKPVQTDASAAKPAPAPGEAAKTVAPAGNWVVKLGAFADISNVNRLQSQLTAAGIKSYTEVYDSSQGPRTRVRAGPYVSRAAAEHAREKLKKIGVDGTVGEK
jgi:DedD protein